jgi:polar amino acid transport system substrate-binding protein
MIFSHHVIADNDLTDPNQIISAIENLNWVTEEYPPFNYKDPQTGEITGIGVEILLNIFDKLGVTRNKVELKIYPWARGYNQLLNDPQTALFSTTYSEKRLKEMKFVGPIAVNIVAVIAPKFRHLSIKNTNDLNGLTIGVIRDDIGEQLLLSEGVSPKSLDQLNSGLSIVKKLDSGRIDAMSYAYATSQILFKKANIDPNKFEIIHVLKYSNMGYAFNNKIDDRILVPMQKALNELIADGTIAQLQMKYGLEHNR